jgi:serine/threonine-protein kinase
MAICPNCQRQSGEVLDPCPSGDGYYCIDEQDYYSHEGDRLLGRKIADRYTVQSVLGRGSMSRVYRAHQGQVDRSVALKVFRPETILGERDPGRSDADERQRAESRFVREARVLGKLSHPNCVTVYDFGADDDARVLFMAMEHVAGVSLRSAIRRGLKLDAMLEIARQVLRALREAHSLSIVHRDLKPENILLTFRRSSEQQVVKVLDFGIAKLVRADTDDTDSDKLFGTPAYMSPEQCRGDTGSIGPTADIYAFGCLFYEMICGQLPFDEDDPQRMVRAHLYEEVPEVVPRAGLEIPDSLRAFTTACLQKDPEERFPTAHEALGALKEAVRGADISLGRGLTVEGEGGIDGKCPERSRKVVVPENRVSGAELDPIDDGDGAEEVSGDEATEKPEPTVRSESSPSSRRQADQELGSRRVNDTMSGDSPESSWVERYTDKLEGVDRQTVVILAATAVALGFSALVFYYIYAMMAGS